MGSTKSHKNLGKQGGELSLSADSNTRPILAQLWEMSIVERHAPAGTANDAEPKYKERKIESN